MNHNAYYFSSDQGGTEFIVISESSREEIRDEYETTGCQLQDVVPLDGDCTSWPCDRKLVKE